ncbi:MAG: DUF354 domain-containing protein [Treponema sp.]|nr:DUF354 domain-containing protein [Treponema sp.]
MIYLFYGLGSSYSLNPLAKYMIAKNFNVIEIDPISNKYSGYEVLKEIKGNDITFITSTHPLLDMRNYLRAHSINNKESYKEKYFIISSLEIIEYLKPIKNIYYPHDLNPFYADYELPWCKMFDIFMLPYKNNLYYELKAKCNDVIEIGWIKNNTLNTKANIEYNVIYFPSFLSFSDNMNYKEIYNIISNRINNTVPIKYVNTKKNNITSAINLLKKDGFIFLDENMNIFQLMHNCDLIIGDGDSSIIFEAALSGVPVVSILNGEKSDEEYLNNIPKYNWVYPLKIIDVKEFINNVKQNKIKLSKGPNILKEFNFEKAIEVIIN